MPITLTPAFFMRWMSFQPNVPSSAPPAWIAVMPVCVVACSTGCSSNPYFLSSPNLRMTKGGNEFVPDGLCSSRTLPPSP